MRFFANISIIILAGMCAGQSYLEVHDYGVSARVDTGIGYDYASITETPSRPSNLAISAYPNPFNSAVTITIDGEFESPMRIEIYDMSGRRVAVAEPVEATVGRLAKDTSTLRQAQGTASSVSVKSPLSKGVLGGLVWCPDPSFPSGVYLVRAGNVAGSAFTRVMYLK
ncbi:MAG TPA: T9SS type A sorting domain-containing protein [candidate division Zixibacteria bacterium]|nr:T9SS type A sorting domain-containing protein [candidate division Zixibacteria bacterium]